MLLILKNKYKNIKKHKWSKYLLYLLSQNSHIDNIVINKDMPNILVKKGHHFIPFWLDNQLFIIDEWDFDSPTTKLINAPPPSYYIDNKAVILKIQYNIEHKNKYNILYDKYKIKVLPFIMFPSRLFPLEYTKWENKNHNLLCFHSGKNWGSRHKWTEYLIEHDMLVIDHNFRAERTKIVNDNFYELLKNTKWGLILKGRGSAGKNRREVEYMSLGMPLALNYKPYYLFNYEPNKHYVYLEKPEDILKLKDIDPEPYSKHSIEIYDKYYSQPHGLYNSFNLMLNSVYSE